MKARVIVTAVIEKGNKVLFGRKPDGVGPYPDCWHLPGGGVNIEVESVEYALKREIEEETGLKVASFDKVSFDEDYEPDKRGEMTHYIFLMYHVIPVDMNSKAGDDINRLQWIDKKEIKKLVLTRPSIKYFKAVGLF